MSEMKPKLALTYDDIQLVMKYSEVESRRNISLVTQLTKNFKLMTPLVAAPMDTVCEFKMAKKLTQLGGAGVIHRFMSINEQVKNVENLVSYINGEGYDEISNIWNIPTSEIPIVAAIGSNGDFLERTKALVNAGANVVVIDVAHGHHVNVKRAIEAIRNENIKVDIIAGNIATAEAAIDLQNWGADGLRIGIGGGCFTPNMKVKTDNGYKPISEINIGDYVYSHNGELNQVLNKLEFDRNEEIVVVNDIECTKNHEFYVVHKKFKDIINETNIDEYAEWISAGVLNDDYLLVEV